jgi:hypothetical protein
MYFLEYATTNLVEQCLFVLVKSPQVSNEYEIQTLGLGFNIFCLFSLHGSLS